MGKFAAVVLAAGRSTRMKSQTPKVLFPVAGKPMLQHIVNVLAEAGTDGIRVVVGYKAETVQANIAGPISWVIQKQQLGTGHALAQAGNSLQGHGGSVLVLAGDTPLLTAATLRALVAYHQQNKNAATLLSALVPRPAGYGRIVRANAKVIAIVEEKDANEEQKSINEINSGTYCFDWSIVQSYLARLKNNNAQGEYYLTDIFALLVANGEKIGAFAAPDPEETLGLNDRVALALAEKIMRRRICHNLMLQGVSILDPASTWIDAEVQVGPETLIYPNTFIRGSTKIGRGCEIGPNVTIESSSIGDDVQIHYAVVETANVSDSARIGPFSYLRPGAQIGSRVKIGDFVEIKNSKIGDGAKVPHLAYVGDASVGVNSNLGCGVITANYDGVNKHKTEIGDGVFIGCNSNLVAPIKVGDGAYVAAGSTVTADVPKNALAIARGRQTNKPNWRPKE